MTKRTKIFRIVICVLLALTMIWSAFSFLMYIFKDYGIYVTGALVTNRNADDILGDGTVYYDANPLLLAISLSAISYVIIIVINGILNIVDNLFTKKH